MIETLTLIGACLLIFAVGATVGFWRGVQMTASEVHRRIEEGEDLSLELLSKNPPKDLRFWFTLPGKRGNVYTDPKGVVYIRRGDHWWIPRQAWKREGAA